jgi:hypothetical protein
MMSKKLRECPLCGEQARLSSKGDPWTWCTNPVCDIYDVEVHVDKWNVRPGEDALHATIKKFQEFIDDISGGVFRGTLSDFHKNVLKKAFKKLENGDEQR